MALDRSVRDLSLAADDICAEVDRLRDECIAWRRCVESLTVMAEAHVRGDANVSPEAIALAGRAYLASGRLGG